jgi:hypothetical protein
MIVKTVGALAQEAACRYGLVGYGRKEGEPRNLDCISQVLAAITPFLNIFSKRELGQVRVGVGNGQLAYYEVSPLLMFRSGDASALFSQLGGLERPESPLYEMLVTGANQQADKRRVLNEELLDNLLVSIVVPQFLSRGMYNAFGKITELSQGDIGIFLNVHLTRLLPEDPKLVAELMDKIYKGAFVSKYLRLITTNFAFTLNPENMLVYATRENGPVEYNGEYDDVLKAAFKQAILTKQVTDKTPLSLAISFVLPK